MAEQPNGRPTILGFIRDVRGALFAQRSTIVISLFAAYVLAFPAVTREVYRILADDAYALLSLSTRQIVARGVTWVPTCFAFVTLALAALAIWYVGRDLTAQAEGEQLRARTIRGFLLRATPVVFALLLPLGAAWGLYSASLDAQGIGSLQYNIAQPFHPDYPSPMTETQSDLKRLLGSMAAVSWLLRGGAYICVGLAVVLLIAMLLIGWRRRGAGFGAVTRYGLMAVAAGIVALFSITVAVPFFSGVPRWVGTVALFNLFVVSLALLVGLAILVSDRFSIPVLLIVVGFALVLSLLDVNDNHVVQQVQAKQSGRWKGATEEFRSWLESRADRAAYQNEPYPVFVVSAAGGGLYAALHSARFLARVQDHCPHFAQHIFAISGVSGGSVGSAVFASLVNSKVPSQETVPNCKAFGQGPGPLEKDVNAILNRDYLSPIVAASLFPDLLQRFIPVPITKFDRGQVLDSVLEAAWRKRFPNMPNPLEMPMSDLWNPKGVTPALVLNATHVATGGRFAMAAFQPRRGDQTAIKLEWVQGYLQNRAIEPAPGDLDPTGHEDLKLSSAAGISARFPWIMPPATVVAPRQTTDRNSKTTRLRLVDGGYFENSGADTAGDLIRAMEFARSPGMPAFKIYTLVLTGYDNEVFGGNFNDETPLGEFLAPIRGLLSTRVARGDETIIRTLDYLCPDLDNCNSEPENRGWYNKARWIFATLNLKDSKLPLSWHLSAFSRRFIGLHAGAPSDCGNAFSAIVPLWTGLPNEPLPPAPLKPPRVMAALNNANCAASIVCGQLANKKLAFADQTGKMENYCTSWETAAPAEAPGKPVRN